MTRIAIHLVIAFGLVQTAPIGSALSDGVQLVYESGGAEQTPWVYDSVRISSRAGYEHCVVVSRPSLPARESCVRGDTLFERNADGTHVPVRPIGPGMRLAVPTASGNVLHYTTGSVTVRRVGAGLELPVVATTIVTRDAAGTVLRRLREDYAPSLLTAVRGVFEEADPDGGWRTVREFSLRDVRKPAAGG